MGSAENLQPWSIATTISVTVLALVAVALRLLSRYEKRQKLWWDDWMILWSMAWNLLVVGFIFGMISCGMGKHAAIVPVKDIVLMAKLLVVAEILYVFNLVWTKLSLLLMYYRIFRFPYFKKWAIIIGTFIGCWVVCITFLFIFICVPVQKLWYPQLPGRCINQVGTWVANAISTIVTDIVILALPIPQIWKLKLRNPEKIVLTVTFALGCFVIFSSAYRFSVLFSYSNDDPPYTLAPTVGWTAIEMSAGIVSACLPTLKPAFDLIVRVLHIKPLVGMFRSDDSIDASKAAPTDNKTNPLTKTIGGTNNHSRKDSFYRLPGETRSDDSEGIESNLRPAHGYEYTVTTTPGSGTGETHSVDGDEIPLHSIRVDTKFEQSCP